LADAGTSILLIEQNTRLVHTVAQRYHVLSKGSIVESASMAGLSMEALHKHIMV
jgi:ABC-type branched-subunit amino acid transport system ATPase component